MSVFYEKGNYRVQFTTQGFSKSKNGNMQFILKFRVLGYADGESVEQQYERSMYQTITEKTAEWIADNLASIGYTGDKWSTLDPATPNYHTFSGVETELYCAPKPDLSGEMRENWGFPMQAKSIDPMETSELRKLDALFGKQLKTATKSPASPKPQVIRQAQPAAAMSNGMEISDDDVPF